jgi:hypothetical protein
MSEPPFKIRPLILPPLVGRELQELRGRVADGIFLGGDFQDAYDSYLVAHRDRQRLLELVDDMSVTVHAARLRSEEGGDELRALQADAARYRYLRESPHFNSDKCRLEWYLERWWSGKKTVAERLDESVDNAIKEKK